MNVQNLKLDTHFLCGSTSATYSDINLVRNLNVAYNDVARLIWDSADGWQYDDSNATTLPIATSSLVHNQQDYSLPSTAQIIRRVEVLDKNGNYTKLRALDGQDVHSALSEYNGGSAGLPTHYDLIGRSVMLYPTPSSAYATLTNGLKLVFDRDVTEFAVTATTTEPGFATSFHRILSYAAAIDFMQDDNQRQFLMQQKDRLEKGLVRFYSKRNVERPSSLKPKNKRRWRQFL